MHAATAKGVTLAAERPALVARPVGDARPVRGGAVARRRVARRCIEAGTGGGRSTTDRETDDPDREPLEVHRPMMRQTARSRPLVVSAPLALLAPMGSVVAPRPVRAAARARCPRRRDVLTCSADGASIVDPEGVLAPCSPFKCKDAACIEKCVTSEDCTTGTLCDESGRCVPPTNAAPGADGSLGCRVSRGPRDEGTALSCAMIGLGVAMRRARRRRRLRFLRDVRRLRLYARRAPTAALAARYDAARPRHVERRWDACSAPRRAPRVASWRSLSRAGRCRCR